MISACCPSAPPNIHSIHVLKYMVTVTSLPNVFHPVRINGAGIILSNSDNNRYKGSTVNFNDYSVADMNHFYFTYTAY